MYFFACFILNFDLLNFQNFLELNLGKLKQKLGSKSIISLRLSHAVKCKRCADENIVI